MPSVENSLDGDRDDRRRKFIDFRGEEDDAEEGREGSSLLS